MDSAFIARSSTKTCRDGTSSACRLNCRSGNVRSLGKRESGRCTNMWSFPIRKRGAGCARPRDGCQCANDIFMRLSSTSRHGTGKSNQWELPCGCFVNSRVPRSDSQDPDTWLVRGMEWGTQGRVHSRLGPWRQIEPQAASQRAVNSKSE